MYPVVIKHGNWKSTISFIYFILDFPLPCLIIRGCIHMYIYICTIYIYTQYIYIYTIYTFLLTLSGMIHRHICQIGANIGTKRRLNKCHFFAVTATATFREVWEIFLRAVLSCNSHGIPRLRPRRVKRLWAVCLVARHPKWRSPRAMLRSVRDKGNWAASWYVVVMGRITWP